MISACMDAQTVVSVTLATLTGMAAAGAAYYLTNKPHQYLPDLSILSDQSVQLDDGSRVSGYCSLEDFKPSYYPDATTTYECFLRGLKHSDNGDCVAFRTAPNDPFQWLSYQKVYDMAHNFGSGLVNLGIAPAQETFIGIYCANCIEWDVVDLACSMFSMVSVPLYDTLNPSGCTYVINHTEIETLVCDSEVRISTLLNVPELLHVLKRIITVVDVSESVMKMASSCGVEIFRFADIMESGNTRSHEVQPSHIDDLFTICYTSGTTGEPKGVMVTQKNFIAQLSSILTHIESHNVVTSADRHLSYLPLAHMFERVIHHFVFMHGAKLGYYCGDVKLLLNDFKLMKPTFFFTVPRLVNKIYDKVLQGVKSSKLKTYLFNWAMKSKSRELNQGIIRNNGIWDILVFKKVAHALGGCINFIVVSSAPLSFDALQFLRCAAGCVVVECYGSSEMCGAVTGNILGEFTPGHVGPPIPGYQVKLVDVPDMGYFADKGHGEVCVKGVGVCAGYYRNVEKTRELIDSEGWAHSGDIGEWCSTGVLKIIGRKKDIFKLSQGEYIAVEKIENVYMRCPEILQIFVTGDTLQNYPVAVLVPDPDVVMPWAKSKSISGTLKELCNNEVIIEYIMKSMQVQAQKQKLCSFEQVRKFCIHPKPFTVDDGLLTPTLKNKRSALQIHFSNEVIKLYEE